MPKIKHLSVDIRCNVPVVSVSTNMISDNVTELPSSDPLMLDGIFEFVYDYPLSHTASFKRALAPSMTGLDLLLMGRSDYERIYKEEEESGKICKKSPFLLNRGRSNGKHGIWGHVIEDLCFECIHIDRDGKIISFGIGS